MFENSTNFLQSELDYRTNRIRATTRGKRRGHVRFPHVRRSAVSGDNIR